MSANKHEVSRVGKSVRAILNGKECKLESGQSDLAKVGEGENAMTAFCVDLILGTVQPNVARALDTDKAADKAGLKGKARPAAFRSLYRTLRGRDPSDATINAVSVAWRHTVRERVRAWEWYLGTLSKGVQTAEPTLQALEKGLKGKAAGGKGTGRGKGTDWKAYLMKLVDGIGDEAAMIHFEQEEWDNIVKARPTEKAE
jgi:hypothetical protein